MKLKFLKRKESGLTLVELLISLVIISFILIPIINFYTFFLRQSNRSKQETRLVFLAQEELEKIISLDYRDPSLQAFASTAGRTNFYERNEFLIKTNVVLIDPETGTIPEIYPVNDDQDTLLKKIVVSVARKDKNGGQVDYTFFKSP